MERKIGEIFEYNGEWCQCVEDTEYISCINCCFYNGGHKLCTDKDIGNCVREYRSDAKSICFKKLEKVGEPYEKRVSDGTFSTFQKYKVCNPVILLEKPYMYYNFIDNTIEIEIKQNKEDMKDNKKQTSLNSTKGIYEKFKGKTVQCLVNNKDGDLVNGYGIVCGYTDKYLIIGFTNGYEGCIKSFTDNVFLENRDFLSYRSWNISHFDNKPFIKPFNLEAARSGKPVCTRDGHKARIICFDLKNEEEYPIVAAIENDSHEILLCYTLNGEIVKGAYEANKDLMMLSEKKEGWINIYNADTTFYYVDGRVFKTKDEAIQQAKEEVEKEQRERNEYIDTIRVEWEE